MFAQVFDLAGYTLSLSSIPTLVTMAAVLTLGVLVLVRERISLVSVSFLLVTLAAVIWLFSFSCMYSAGKEDVALWWAKASLLGIPFIAAASYQFTVTVLRIYERYRGVVWAGWLLAALFASVGIATDILISGVYPYEWGYYPRYSWLGIPFVLYFFVMLAANITHYWTERRRAHPEIHRRRIDALMLAFGIGYIGCLDFAAVYGVPLYPFGYIPILGFVLIVARAIWTYHLADITPAFAAQQIIDTMTGGLLVLDPDGVVRLVNRAATEVLGYTEEELVGKPVGPALNNELFSTQLHTLLQTGVLRNYEMPYRTKQGDSRILSLSASVMTDKGEQPVALVCVAKDITERKLAEERVRQQNEYLAALHETSLGVMNRLELADLLEAVIQRAASLVGSSHGFIYVVEPGETEMSVQAGVGIFAQNIGYRIGYGEGVAGKVWQTDQPMAVDNYRTWEGRASNLAHMNLHAVSGVPLKSGSKVVGVLGVAYREEGRTFSQDEIELLRRFGQLASIALDNARLYEHSQLELAERKLAEEEVRQLNDSLERRVVERTGQLEAANEDLKNEITERKRAEKERAQLLVREQQHAIQLRRLADASLVINSALSIDKMLQAITDQAREIIGAHQAITSMVAGENWAHAVNALSLSDKYSAWQGHGPPSDRTDIHAAICKTNKPIRLTQDELEKHTEYSELIHKGGNHPPMRGWLAAPLIRRDGKNLGLIQLSDKYDDEFTTQDEAILVQLAQMASIAIENARLYEDAQEAARAREQLLAIVSHDLRNPVGVIKGSAKMLQKHIEQAGQPESKQLSDGLGRIDIAASKMDALISELLDFARAQVGQPLDLDRRPTDLLELTRHVAGQHKHSMGRHPIRIESNIPRLVGPWDGTRLERALDNLVSNAVKYSPAGGEIIVALDQKEAEGGSWAVLSVRDNGIGIPAQDIPHLFEWFHRAGNVAGRFSGTGIGLASARQVVEQHGGSICVSSQEGAGSTFTVRLPLAVPEQSDLTPAS